MLDSIMERLTSLWMSIRLSWGLMQDARVPMWAKAIPVLAALYIFSPIDILPDFFLALGQVDDLLILTMALEFFTRMAPSEVVEEYRQKLLNESN